MQDLELSANIASIRNGTAVAFCVFGNFVTLCLLGLGLGLGFDWIRAKAPSDTVFFV